MLVSLTNITSSCDMSHGRELNMILLASPVTSYNDMLYHLQGSEITQNYYNKVFKDSSHTLPAVVYVIDERAINSYYPVVSINQNA